MPAGVNEDGYWQRQEPKKPALFKGIDLMPPEQKKFAGNFLVLGGRAGAFFTVMKTAEELKTQKVASVEVFLPDSLKKVLPAKLENVAFLPSERAGGFAGELSKETLARVQDKDAVVLAGDLGKGKASEALALAFLQRAPKQQCFFAARDAVEVLTARAQAVFAQERELFLLLTKAQLKKLFEALYFPRIVALTTPLIQMVEIVHKFGLSYPRVTLITVVEGQVLLAQNGQVVTLPLTMTPWNLLSIWDGEALARMAAIRIWNKAQSGMQAVAMALVVC